MKKAYFLIFFVLSTGLCWSQYYSWFAISSPILIKDKLRKCHDYKLAGNKLVYQLCVTSTLNAYDYLIDRTKDENVHEAFWAMCADTIQYEFELGSRCMAAAMDICKLSDNKNMILEPLSCYRIFDEHTWVASPAAHKLNFTKPVRKEEEISKYVQ